MAGVGDKSQQQQQQPQQQQPYHPTTPDLEFFVHDPSASSSSAKETPAAVKKQVREAGNLRQHLREAEVPTVKPLRTPADPTQAEWDEHSVCHFPYRAWCRACVAGRGRADPHFRDTGDDKLKPSVHCDYCFMGEKNDVEEGDGGTLPIIVISFQAIIGSLHTRSDAKASMLGLWRLVVATCLNGALSTSSTSQIKRLAFLRSRRMLWPSFGP